MFYGGVKVPLFLVRLQTGWGMLTQRFFLNTKNVTILVSDTFDLSYIGLSFLSDQNPVWTKTETNPLFILSTITSYPDASFI